MCYEEAKLMKNIYVLLDMCFFSSSFFFLIYTDFKFPIHISHQHAHWKLISLITGGSS